MNGMHPVIRAAHFGLHRPKVKNAVNLGKKAIYFIACLACVFGTWGFLCLLLGLVSHGGDLSSLGMDWLSAIRSL